MDLAELFSKCLVVVKVGGRLLEGDENLHHLAANMASWKHTAFLIVPGAGRQIDRAVGPGRRIEGLRVTPASDIHVIGDIYTDLLFRAREVFVKHGLGCQKVYGNHGLLRAARSEDPALGEAGHITAVDEDFIPAQLRAVREPVVVTPMAKCAKSGWDYLNVNADEAAASLAAHLNADALVFLTTEDGVYDGDGNVIDFLGAEDLDRIYKGSGTAPVKSGMRLKALTAGVASKKVPNVVIGRGDMEMPIANALGQVKGGTKVEG